MKLDDAQIDKALAIIAERDTLRAELARVRQACAEELRQKLLSLDDIPQRTHITLLECADRIEHGELPDVGAAPEGERGRG